MTTFTPSPEQSAFFTELRNSSDSLMLIACAGAGKSTAIEHALHYIPDVRQKAIAIIAFSKDIVAAMKDRVPDWMKDNVSTQHRIGFQAWKRFTGKSFNMDKGKNKLFSILKDTLSHKDFNLYASTAQRLIGLAKNAGLGTSAMDDTHQNWFALIAHSNLVLQSDEADESRLVEISRDTLTRSNNMGRELIDFDDMLYLPILHNCAFDKRNVVFVDEAQDTNCLQRMMLHKMLAPAPHGRLIAVGDPSQAIFGFRGADANAMNALREEFSMKVLPLSVSYRCSKAVVAEAQKYVTTL